MESSEQHTVKEWLQRAETLLSSEMYRQSVSLSYAERARRFRSAGDTTMVMANEVHNALHGMLFTNAASEKWRTTPRWRRDDIDLPAAEWNLRDLLTQNYPIPSLSEWDARLESVITNPSELFTYHASRTTENDIDELTSEFRQIWKSARQRTDLGCPEKDIIENLVRYACAVRENLVTIQLPALQDDPQFSLKMNRIWTDGEIAEKAHVVTKIQIGI